MSFRSFMVSSALLFVCAVGSAWGHVQLAPGLVGDTWLNTSSPVALGHGKVSVVHFWTFECINCRHNLPSYRHWEDKFRSQGVQFIGIHTPELKEERSVENVKKFVSKEGIDYPVLIDNEMRNWRLWQVEAWPSVFLVDKHGRVRDSWVGELNYNGGDGEARFAKEIAQLILEK